MPSGFSSVFSSGTVSYGRTTAVLSSRPGSSACTASAITGEQWCYHHHPGYAQERRRNASRAATLGNSKIGAEIRRTRFLVRDIVELTVSGALDPLIRKRLAEIAQLLQIYARLAELEIASGEKPRLGDVIFPEDMPEQVWEWAKEEAEGNAEGGILLGKLQAAAKDPRAVHEGMG